MVKKGVISKIEGMYAEVFIPEENNAVTPLLPFSKSISSEVVKVGDNCVVVFFDTEHINFANGVIIAIY